jgi:hypothetical protein
VLVGQSDWTRDLDILGLSVTYELVSDLLNGVELISAEGDSRSLDFLVLNSLFLSVLVSHEFANISNIYG